MDMKPGKVIKKEGKPTAQELDRVIEDLVESFMDKMAIPEYERNTDIDVYPIGETDFIYMISFRGEVIGSVLLYENRVVSTGYFTEKEISNFN